MGTKTQLLDWCRKQLGTVGGSKYWQDVKGWSGGGLPWCAIFCSDALKQTNTPCNYFPNTVAFDRRDSAVIGSAWVDRYALQAGDMVSFDWDGDGGGDHVGIVEKVLGDGVYQTIEGNVSNSVGRRTRYAANILGGIRPKYHEPVFPDVDESTPHFKDIRWLKENGIATGYIDGTFRPNAATARSDMAAFLHRLAGTPIFKDVNAKTAHAEDIWWMAAKGISQGYPDGAYRPSANMTRGDVAAFLCRFVNGPLYTYEPTQGDVERFGDVDWQTPHCREVWWMAHMGISTGFSDGTFRPNATLKRCDAAAFLHRVDGLAGV